MAARPRRTTGSTPTSSTTGGPSLPPGSVSATTISVTARSCVAGRLSGSPAVTGWTTGASRSSITFSPFRKLTMRSSILIRVAVRAPARGSSSSISRQYLSGRCGDTTSQLASGSTLSASASVG